MDGFGFLGIHRTPRLRRDDSPIEHILVQRPLHRILAFTGFSIDDIVNNSMAKNIVFGYFKLHKQIARFSEVVDLERQWNQADLKF